MPPNGDAKGRDPSHYPSGLGFSGSTLGRSVVIHSMFWTAHPMMKLNMIVYFLHIIHIFLGAWMFPLYQLYHVSPPFFNKGNLGYSGISLGSQECRGLNRLITGLGDFGAGCLRACVGSVPWWVQAPQIGNEKIYEHHGLFHALYEPNNMILEDHWSSDTWNAWRLRLSITRVLCWCLVCCYGFSCSRRYKVCRRQPWKMPICAEEALRKCLAAREMEKGEDDVSSYHSMLLL